MKQSLTLANLASELTRLQQAKKDFIARSSALSFSGDASEMVLTNGAEHRFGIRELAHGQIAGRLDIPKKYYDRMRKEAPQLLADNVNHWFENSPDRRMVRTMSGDVRAFMSDRYLRVENEEIAGVTLPVLGEIPDMRVESCAVTESKMYIKAVFPRIEGEVKKGDVVQSGVVISNSEVGSGAVSVAPLVYRLVCLNGLIVPDSRVRGFHIGGRASDGEDVYHLLSDETRAADDKAILLKLRDVVRAAANPEFFKRTLEKLQVAAGQVIEGNPAEAVEEMSNKFGMTEDEKGGVLRHLIMGGDLSRWGLINAVTAQSQDIEDYDRATAFEAFGGQLLAA